MQETSTPPGTAPTDQTQVKASSLSDIQLIVVDLDGTTVGKSNQIRPAVKQALSAARAQGVQVAIATGRMYRSALRFYQELDLTLPLMVYQGALIKEPSTGLVHQHLKVPKDYVAQLLDFLSEPELRSIVSVHLYIDDCLYVREINAETEAYTARSEVEAIAVGDLRQVLHMEPTKLLALSDEVDLIDRLFGDLQQRYTPAELYLTKSVATFLEATHPLVNKGQAVRYLAEDILGLHAAQVMAIGDNFNDLEMLQYAGTGVAMGGAPAGVKSVADWVAPDVEADGVAAAITEFVLSPG